MNKHWAFLCNIQQFRSNIPKGRLMHISGSNNHVNEHIRIDLNYQHSINELWDKINPKCLYTYAYAQSHCIIHTISLPSSIAASW